MPRPRASLVASSELVFSFQSFDAYLPLLYLLVETGVLYNRTGSGLPKLACQNSRALVGGGISLSEREKGGTHCSIFYFIFYLLSYESITILYTIHRHCQAQTLDSFGMIIAVHNFPKSIYINNLRHGGRPPRDLSPLDVRLYEELPI